MAITMQQQVIGTRYTYQGVGVEVGRHVNAGQREVLPVGAVINRRLDEHGAPVLMEKTVDGRWVSNRGTEQNNFGDSILWGVPEGVHHDQETIDEFMHRFRAKALDAARRHLGDTSEVLTIMEKLHVPDTTFSEGEAVYVNNKALPVGTVVMAGDPSSANYAVWQRVEDGWDVEFGQDAEPPRTAPVTVIDIPETVLRHTPNAQDPGKIAAFKAAAWKEGWALKRRHGWCSAYEQIMVDVGLTAADSMPDFSGYPQSETWRDLPDGAILGYNGAALWDLAVRDRSRDSGLRRLAGTSNGGLARNRWRVVWNGIGGMRIPSHVWLLVAVPVGSQVTYNDTGGYVYEKREDGTWIGVGMNNREQVVENGGDLDEGSWSLTRIGS